MEVSTIHRDRVNLALDHQRPDRTPRDFAAVPEIWGKLGDYFGTQDRKEILKHLDVDCRVISYDSFCRPPHLDSGNVDMNGSQERSSVGGMWRKVELDGSTRDVWGAHRAKVPNAYGVLDQLVSFPLESASNLEDLRHYPWPQPDWWDFGRLRPAIEELNESARYNIRYRVGSVFETAWSICGLEKFLLDLAQAPALPIYIVERIAETHLANLKAVLEHAADLIDIVYFYDDLASQQGLLISPCMYERSIQPFHQKLIDLAARFHKPVMMHCCGSVYQLIPRLIEIGLNILNPIQPSARNMNPEKLAHEFGGRLVFHGGIDVQMFLPRATPDEVREKVAYTCEVLGANGGYVMSGSHHIQADTPLENVLAMYSNE